MTGKGHRMFGAGFGVITATLLAPAFGVTTAALVVAGSLPGSTAPDWLEIKIGNKRLIRHRTVTHLLILWLSLICVAFLVLDNYGLLAAFILGFAVGGLSHWVGDLGTPLGVPVWHPGRRISLSLWKGETELIPIAVLWLFVAAVGLISAETEAVLKISKYLLITAETLSI